MTAATPPGESDGASGELPDVAELEAALVDLVEVLRQRSALSREFKEAARLAVARAESRTNIEAGQFEAVIDEDTQLLTATLGPVAEGLAAIAPKLEQVVARFDRAIRSLVQHLSGTSLVPEIRSEADDVLDGVLQLLAVVSVRPMAERSASAFNGFGNPDLRAVLDQLTSAFRALDEQDDVLLALSEPIHALPNRALPPGAPATGRPSTAPELLAAEAAANRWFDSVQLWSDASHEFGVAAEEATAETAAAERGVDQAAVLRRLGSAMAPAAGQLELAAREYGGRTTELDAAVRVLLERLSSRQLSDPDQRQALSLFRGLKRFADETAEDTASSDDALGGMSDLGRAGGAEVDSGWRAVTAASELASANERIIAGWLALPTEIDPSGQRGAIRSRPNK